MYEATTVEEKMILLNDLQRILKESKEALGELSLNKCEESPYRQDPIAPRMALGHGNVLKVLQHRLSPVRGDKCLHGFSSAANANRHFSALK
jgi:hypothetical protein